MTAWATDTNYSAQTGDAAAYNGTPTKVAPVAPEQGFVPTKPVSAQEVNHALADVDTKVSAAVVSIAAFTRLAAFGTGIDGDVTISGTVTLTRAMHYRNLTLAAGADLRPAGWPIYVSEEFNVENAPAGAINYNGGNGTPGTDNPGQPGTLAGSGNTDRPFSQLNGGSGGTGNSGGSSGGGGGQTASIWQEGNTDCCKGGTGGTGTGGGTNVASGAQTITDAKVGTIEFGLLAQERLWNNAIGVFARLRLAGSTGGCGGGGGTANSADDGGGGGAPGGVVQIWARTIRRGASTAAAFIKANAGNGAVGNSAGGTFGSGGGGGGGGGQVFLFFAELLGTLKSAAIQCNGGSGADGAGSGGSKAAGGGSGSGGRAHLIKLTTSARTVTNGSAGGAPTGGTGNVTPGTCNADL